MTKNKYTNLLLQTLGCFISAAGIYSFAVAAEVPVTGIAGICAILYRLFGIPMGLSNVLINIPIILCTYKLLGKSFFIRSVYCMVLFAVFTDYLLPLMPVYQGDRLLATICGGVVGGIGDALIYMNNSSTGGLDFITMGIKAKHPHLPLGRFIMLTDGIVVVLGGIIFRDFDGIVYGMMIDLIFAVIADKIMYGANAGKLALIVTTGGTGFAPRDVTPEATIKVCEKLAPGIPEAMRAASMQITPKACLSRAAAGIRGTSLIINLPGSPKGACENLQAVLEPIEHGIYILQGGKE